MLHASRYISREFCTIQSCHPDSKQVSSTAGSVDSSIEKPGIRIGTKQADTFKNSRSTSYISCRYFRLQEIENEGTCQSRRIKMIRWRVAGISISIPVCAKG